jgi:hypothetical protein
VLVGLSYLPFLWRSRGRTTLLFVVAGLIYGGGAVGIEHFPDSEVNSLHYNMWTALEEDIEMYGVIVLIYAVLHFIQRNSVSTLTVEVGSQVPERRAPAHLQFTVAGSTRVGVTSPEMMRSAPMAIARMVLVMWIKSSVSTWSLT